MNDDEEEENDDDNNNNNSNNNNNKTLGEIKGKEASLDVAQCLRKSRPAFQHGSEGKFFVLFLIYLLDMC